MDQKMYALSLLYFEDIGYKFEPNVWNKFRDVLMTAYELKKHCNIKYKRCWWEMYFMGVLIKMKLIIF